MHPVFARRSRGGHRAAIALVIATLALAGPVVEAAPGIWDTSFNGSGIAQRDVGPGNDVAWAAAVQPDGKIVVVGGCSKTGGAGARNWCIVRLNANGSIDASGFGNLGVVQLAAAQDQYASGVAVLPSGDILVTGTCAAKFCAYRLSPSGGIQVNFGDQSPSGGRALYGPSGFTLEARMMLLQPDGRFLIGGSCFNAQAVESSCIARFNPDGSLDTAFGQGGGNGVQFGFISSKIFRLGALALQSDGKIVYAASWNDGVTWSMSRGRHHADGSPDGAFISSALAPPGSTSALTTGIAVQADGRVLIAGYCNVSGVLRFCAARVQGDDGAVDTGYGAGGYFVAPTTVLGGGGAASLVVQPDGKAILSGTWSGNFSAIRLNDDGSLDTTWAGTGYTYGNIANNDVLHASVLQRDGKLLWAGQCAPSGSYPQMCVQRVGGGPFGASACTLDVDGDGRVGATTDLLILARVQAGVTGSAALGGLSFNANATRTTWPAIRQYLVAQCGLAVKE